MICTIRSTLCNHYISSFGLVLLLPASIITLCYLILLCNILALLLLRIYYAFNDSTFQLTKYQKYAFIVSFILIVIAGGSVSITLFITYTSDQTLKDVTNTFELFDYFSAITGFLYFIATCYGIYVFSKKMYSLTNMRAPSVNQFSALEDIDDITLNKQQRDLIKATSKYVALLTLAIVICWIGMIIIMIAYAFVYGYYNESHEGSVIICFHFLHIAIVFNTSGNILCLYLQYSFAKKYYNKYCGCLGKICGCLFAKTLRSSMKRKYKETIEMRENHSEEQEQDIDKNHDGSKGSDVVNEEDKVVAVELSKIKSTRL